MYVCLCNGYTERQVREAIRGGARTVDEVFRTLGGELDCGECALQAQRLIYDTAGDAP